jgi:hypothetical protein
MWRSFSTTATNKKFKAIKPNINLNETNKTVSANSIKSDSFDFSKEDLVPDMEFIPLSWTP